MMKERIERKDGLKDAWARVREKPLVAFFLFLAFTLVTVMLAVYGLVKAVSP